MKLNLNEIKIILQLLERVTINGKEANTFLQVVSKLQKLAQEEPDQPQEKKSKK